MDGFEQLQAAHTGLLQTLRSADDDSEDYRALVSGIHGLCDLHEQVKLSIAEQWELDQKIHQKIVELVEVAKSKIIARSNPIESAESQSEGEDA